MKAGALAEGGAMAALAVLLMLLPRYVPGFGMAGALCSPLPVAFVFRRRGWKTALAAVLSAGLLLVVLLGPADGAMNAVFVGGPGLGLGFALHRRLGLVTGALATGCGAFVFLAINAIALRLFTGQDFVVAPLVRSYNQMVGFAPWLVFLGPWVPLLALCVFFGAALVDGAALLLVARWLIKRLGVK